MAKAIQSAVYTIYGKWDFSPHSPFVHSRYIFLLWILTTHSRVHREVIKRKKHFTTIFTFDEGSSGNKFLLKKWI